MRCNLLGCPFIFGCHYSINQWTTSIKRRRNADYKESKRIRVCQITIIGQKKNNKIFHIIFLALNNLSELRHDPKLQLGESLGNQTFMRNSCSNIRRRLWCESSWLQHSDFNY